MPKQRPRAPAEVKAVLVGPDFRTYTSSFVDRDSRHVALELNIRLDDAGFYERDVCFHLEVHRSRYSGKWGEPFIGPIEFQNYGFHLTLEHAENAVKHLKGVRRYIEKLPVKPQTFGDLVAIIGQIYRIGQMGQMEVYVYDKHNTPAVESEFVSLPRLVHLVQERYDRLAAEE